MEHEEEMVKSHVEQLGELKDVTEKQTTELKKGRKEFSDLNSKIDVVDGKVDKLNDEFIEKKVTNGNTQKEVKTLGEEIRQTSKTVNKIEGILIGRKELKEEEQVKQSGWRDTAKTIMSLIVTPVLALIVVLQAVGVLK